MSRFITRITSCEGAALCSEWKISENEDFFRDHFEGMPIVPGLVMLESMISAATWLARARNDFNVVSFRLAELSNYKLPKSARPGDVLKVKVEMLNSDSQNFRVKGRAEVNGQSTAQGIFSLVEQPARNEHDVVFYRDQCRNNFQELLSR
ncbi:MAG TPA: hypothetical protein VFC63_22190 [Blastocatellia bacterium]|nr:hypothetical protein [Blastocatellia bacterium]